MTVGDPSPPPVLEQTASGPYSAQAPAPSQSPVVPHAETGEALQTPFGSAAPAGRGEQIPALPTKAQTDRNRGTRPHSRPHRRSSGRCTRWPRRRRRPAVSGRTSRGLTPRAPYNPRCSSTRRKHYPATWQGVGSARPRCQRHAGPAPVTRARQGNRVGVEARRRAAHDPSRVLLAGPRPVAGHPRRTSPRLRPYKCPANPRPPRPLASKCLHYRATSTTRTRPRTRRCNTIIRINNPEAQSASRAHFAPLLFAPHEALTHEPSAIRSAARSAEASRRDIETARADQGDVCRLRSVAASPPSRTLASRRRAARCTSCRSEASASVASIARLVKPTERSALVGARSARQRPVQPRRARADALSCRASHTTPRANHVAADATLAEAALAVAADRTVLTEKQTTRQADSDPTNTPSSALDASTEYDSERTARRRSLDATRHAVPHERALLAKRRERQAERTRPGGVDLEREALGSVRGAAPADKKLTKSKVSITSTSSCCTPTREPEAVTPT